MNVSLEPSTLRALSVTALSIAPLGSLIHGAVLSKHYTALFPTRPQQAFFLFLHAALAVSTAVFATSITHEESRVWSWSSDSAYISWFCLLIAQVSACMWSLLYAHDWLYYAFGSDSDTTWWAAIVQFASVLFDVAGKAGFFFGIIANTEEAANTALYIIFAALTLALWILIIALRLWYSGAGNSEYKMVVDNGKRRRGRQM